MARRLDRSNPAQSCLGRTHTTREVSRLAATGALARSNDCLPNRAQATIAIKEESVLNGVHVFKIKCGGSTL